MKTNSGLSLIIYVVLLFITVLSISIIPSCTKMDVYAEKNEIITARFFNIPANAPLAIHKVAAALKEQNEIGGFITLFAKKEGYAVWNESEINIYKSISTILSRNDGPGETQQDTIEVFIPIVLENDNIVNGFFFSRIIGDSVALHLYRANDYDLFPTGKMDSSVVTAELITMKLLDLNEEVFGHRVYVLNDSNIFKNAYTAGRYRTVEWKRDSVPSETGGHKVGPSFTHACWYNQTPDCISTTNWCTFCELVFCVPNSPTIPSGGSSGTTGGGYNWPPDPPILTGGGGGSGGSGPGGNPGNCIGIGCGTLGTTISFGKLPCGGCGSGPISVPPDQPPVIPIDTCDVMKLRGRQMDTLYMKGRVDSMLGTIPGWENDTLERGFPIWKTYTQHPSNGAVTLTSHFPGMMVQSGSGLHIQIPFAAPNFSTKAAGQVHVHLKNGYPSPSPGDIFELLKIHALSNNGNPKLRYDGSIIAGYNNSKYALAVYSPADAYTFQMKEAQFFDSSSAEWKLNSAIQLEFARAFREYFNTQLSGISDTTAREDKAVELANAAVLRQFNSGITLLKRDSLGKFKPLVINVIKDPVDSTKYIYTQGCL